MSTVCVAASVVWVKLWTALAQHGKIKPQVYIVSYVVRIRVRGPRYQVYNKAMNALATPHHIRRVTLYVRLLSCGVRVPDVLLYIPVCLET